MQNVFLTTEDLAELIATNSGFTYNPITGAQPNSGYMVSLRGYDLSENYQDLLDSLKIEEFIDNYLQANTDKLLDNFYCGAWLDDSSGLLFMDVSVNVKDIETACYLGICNDQLAIYDLTNRRSIKLPTPQRSGTETQNNTYNYMTAKKIAHNYLYNNN
jgi:hypothetical protein